MNEWINEDATQYDKILEERDTLIDDIAVLRANEKRYRNRAENAMELSERINCQVLRLEDENEKLRNKLEGSETYNDAIKTYKPMYENLRKQYNSLTQHIRQKAEANPSEHRYIALVNFVDRLEGE